MTEPLRGLPLAVLAATPAAALAACTVPASQSTGHRAVVGRGRRRRPAPVRRPIAAADRAASADSTTTLVVPAGEGPARCPSRGS